MKGFEMVKGWARELVEIMLLFIAAPIPTMVLGTN